MSETHGNGTGVGNKEMEWLYDASSGKPTNEDYLLGKEVDEDFERQGTAGQINAVEYDCCPRSIFSSQVDHQVDLQRKLQEDPLVSIRTKEVDTRKKILDNPLKLREINAYVDSLKKKKHKKEKKHKKHKRDMESTKTADQNLDYILLQKLKGISEDGTSALSSNVESKRDKRTSRLSRRESSSDSSSATSREEERHSKKKLRKKHKNKSSPDNFSRSKTYKERSNSSPRRDLQPSNHHHTANPKGSRIQDRNISSRHSPSTKRRSRSPHDRNKSNKNKDEIDRAKKLEEMMENANWREEQRSSKVKKHRKKESEEEIARLEKHDPSFLRKELSKAAESGSVEKRIKSNRHNIQRGVSSMNENFARR